MFQNVVGQPTAARIAFGKVEKPLHNPSDYYPPQPSRTMLSAARRVTGLVGGMLNVTTAMSEADAQRLTGYLNGKASVIFTPNHSSPLDTLIFPQMGLDKTYRLGALDVFRAKGPVAKLPGSDRVWAKVMQKNGIFSVMRGGAKDSLAKSLGAATDLLVEGKHLTICPEGWVTWTHKMAQQPKAGAGYIAIAAAERGTPVQIVPVTIRYRMLGNAEDVRKGLTGLAERLEDTLSDRMGVNLSKPNLPLEKRVGWLFTRMLMERESLYLDMYGLHLDRRDPDFYIRSEKLREALLHHLETAYGVTGSNGLPHEHRARKVLAKMALLREEKAVGKDALKNYDRDAKTLNDVMGLGMYQQDYMKDTDPGVLLETLMNLERDIRTMVPRKQKNFLPASLWRMQKRVRLYRRAEIQASIRVGEPIDVNQAVKDSPVDDPAQRKALARRLMEDVRCQLQAGMDQG